MVQRHRGGSQLEVIWFWWNLSIIYICFFYFSIPCKMKMIFVFSMGWLLNERDRFYAIVWIEGWVPSPNSIFFLIICRCFVGCIRLYWRLQNFIVPQLTSIQIVKLLSIFPISHFFPYIMEMFDHIFIGVSNENLQQLSKPNRH